MSKSLPTINPELNESGFPILLRMAISWVKINPNNIIHKSIFTVLIRLFSNNSCCWSIYPKSNCTK